MQVSTNTGMHGARPGKERYSPMETVSFLADAGFRVLDFNFCAAIYTDPFTIDRTIVEPGWQHTIEALRNEMEKRQVVAKYSHLPFYRFDEPETADLDFKLEMTLRAIEASGMLGVQWAVVHPSRSKDPDTAEANTVAYLEILLEKATKHGVGLAVENMLSPDETYNNASALCALIERFGEGVCVCWDTGHGNLSKIDDAANIKQLGRRIKMLHVHDNGGIKDEHRPPFLGNIDWQEVMAALASAGFEGDLNFEVSAAPVPESLRRSYAHYVYHTGVYLCGLFAECTRPPREGHA